MDRRRGAKTTEICGWIHHILPKKDCRYDGELLLSESEKHSKGESMFWRPSRKSERDDERKRMCLQAKRGNLGRSIWGSEKNEEQFSSRS